MTTKDRVLVMIKAARAERFEKTASAANPFSNNAYKAGFRKAAEAHGLDPDMMEKLAWWSWGDIKHGIKKGIGAVGGAVAAVGNGAWEGVKGIGTGIANGWENGNGAWDTTKKMFSGAGSGLHKVRRVDLGTDGSKDLFQPRGLPADSRTPCFRRTS